MTELKCPWQGVQIQDTITYFNNIFPSRIRAINASPFSTCNKQSCGWRVEFTFDRTVNTLHQARELRRALNVLRPDNTTLSELRRILHQEGTFHWEVEFILKCGHNRNFQFTDNTVHTVIESTSIIIIIYSFICKISN